MKFCKDCKYLERDFYCLRKAKIEVDPVTGERSVEGKLFARAERGDDPMWWMPWPFLVFDCGPNAKHFEPKQQDMQQRQKLLTYEPSLREAS